MISEYIIVIVLIAIVIIAIVCVFVRSSYNPKKKEILDFVKKNCMTQVNVLLLQKQINTDNLFPSNKCVFTKRQIDAICELSIEEWELWNKLVKDVKYIGVTYNYVFGDFLKENKLIDPSSKIDSASDRDYFIELLTIEQLSLIVTETKDNWERRTNIKKKAFLIKRTYVNGFFKYCNMTKNPIPTDFDIVRDKKRIIAYQRYYEQRKIYIGWEDSQNVFCREYYNICKKARESDGRYFYQIKYNQINEDGKLVESEFKIWQGFVSSFCVYRDDIQPMFMLNQRTKLTAFQNRRRFYNDIVYDGIFKIINDVSSNQPSNTLIIFVNSTTFNWKEITYSYHYKRLKSRLNNDNYKYIDLENLSSIGKESCYESAIIIDFITNVEDLRINSRIVAEYFTKKQPHIAYYSFIKEYTKEEIEKLYA